MFRVSPPFELKKLDVLFRHRVFRMLLNKGKITAEMIAMLSTWRHSGFHVFCGNRISPNDVTAMENLTSYIIQVSFSQERMQYLDQEGGVHLYGQGQKDEQGFPRPGMDGRDVFTHPKQGRADSEIFQFVYSHREKGGSCQLSTPSVTFYLRQFVVGKIIDRQMELS